VAGAPGAARHSSAAAARAKPALPSPSRPAKIQRMVHALADPGCAPHRPGNSAGRYRPSCRRPDRRQHARVHGFGRTFWRRSAARPGRILCRIAQERRCHPRVIARRAAANPVQRALVAPLDTRRCFGRIKREQHSHIGQQKPRLPSRRCSAMKIRRPATRCPRPAGGPAAVQISVARRPRGRVPAPGGSASRHGLRAQRRTAVPPPARSRSDRRSPEPARGWPRRRCPARLARGHHLKPARAQRFGQKLARGRVADAFPTLEHDEAPARWPIPLIGPASASYTVAQRAPPCRRQALLRRSRAAGASRLAPARALSSVATLSPLAIGARSGPLQRMAIV